MPKYLISGSYTEEGIKGLLKDGGTKRRAATRQAVESLGGKLEAYYFAFGDYDFHIISDHPDKLNVVAANLLTRASGAAVKLKTTVLITPEEVDEAVKKNMDYRPPGQ